MSTLGLFAMGTLVTLIVTAGLGILVYGAILDGRDEARFQGDQRRSSEEPLQGRTAASAHTTQREELLMPENLIETAKAAGSFTTLLAAVEVAGLTPTLADGGPFTVFAPTDEAFDALPAGTVDALLIDPAALAAVLTYHVVPGRIAAERIGDDTAPATVQGGALEIAVNGGVTVNDATVIKADVDASNGVIHVIDRVLIPAA